MRIPPRSGTAFYLNQGELLKVTDPEGEQVSDLFCFARDQPTEFLSSGRTIDYAGTIYVTTGHDLYSNNSRKMFTILEDTVGRHDFLLTPCSAEMFRIIYGDADPPPGCFGNLAKAFASFNIKPDQISTTFNLFMNVVVDPETGKIDVLPPRSKAGDYILLKANMDLIVGLTACSAGLSNNFSYKPIEYQILEATL